LQIELTRIGQKQQDLRAVFSLSARYLQRNGIILPEKKDRKCEKKIARGLVLMAGTV
jgi:hypothetical protein